MLRHAGAGTTVWERWRPLDTSLPPSTYNNTSQDHPMFGSIGAWLLQHLAGLDASDIGGAARLRVRPGIAAAGNLLSGASSEQLTARGRAAVAWEVRAAGELRLNVTVPPGCVGEVDVPGNASELVVSESGVVVWRHGAAAGTAEGVAAVAALADGVRLSTVSGSYMVVAE